jgi:hypothetical protein
MRTSFALVAFFVASALGTPVDLQKRQTTLFQCGTGTAECCATDVLGLADLDCATRMSQLATLL